MTALTFTVGDSQAGPLRADLARLPHLLIAGTTGSGKTTLIHSMLTDLLALNPAMLRLVLIDPKRVELRAYRHLPHLIGPPIVSYEEAVAALTWCAVEMERRFALLEAADARDLAAYAGPRPPALVVVIDELANLILVDREAIERPLVQIAAMGRAAGLHLILATQHPSADVLTGLLRANVAARAAFRTATPLDSRIILSVRGAEGLAGAGDMLWRHDGPPVRIQGRYVDDAAIEAAVSRWPTTRPTRPWVVDAEQHDESADVSTQRPTIEWFRPLRQALVGTVAAVFLVGLGLPPLIALLAVLAVIRYVG